MVSFEAAKRNKLLRQSYINSIDLGDYSKYVSTIKYKHQDIKGKTRENIAMQCVTLNGRLTAQGFNGIPSDIHIFPSAFRWFVGTTEGNFLATIEHELRHAQQTYESPEDYFPQLEVLLQEGITDEEREKYQDRIICLSEIDAYRFQLHRIFSGHANVTPEMQQYLIEDLADYCKQLE